MSDIQDFEGWLKLWYTGYVISKPYTWLTNSADLLPIGMIALVPWGISRESRNLPASHYCHELEKATCHLVSVHPASGCSWHQDILQEQKAPKSSPVSFLLYGLWSGPLTLPFGLENSQQILTGSRTGTCWLGPAVCLPSSSQHVCPFGSQFVFS